MYCATPNMSNMFVFFYVRQSLEWPVILNIHVSVGKAVSYKPVYAVFVVEYIE